jgi:2',3'-cyclic-nucleotide 2'-phosphodiesterase (5'-nucleotidase family)
MRFLSIILLFFVALTGCRNTYRVNHVEAENKNVTSITQKKEVTDIVAPYKKQLTNQMNEVLCQNAKDMTKARPESELGNMLSDGCLEIARSNYEGTIDAAMFNTGGIRASLSKGDITVGDIYQLMPFDNELVIVTLPLAEVEAMFSYLQVSGGEPVSNLNLTVSPESVDRTVNGSALEDRTYSILTSDYLSNGGDRMTFFTEGHRIEIVRLGIKVRDALMVYCEELGTSKTILDSKLDGRIEIIK